MVNWKDNIAKLFLDNAYKKYLTYFLIIVFSMSIICVVSYAISNGKINDQIQNNNTLMVKRTALELDGIFKDIHNVLRTLDVMELHISVENSAFKPRENLVKTVDNLANIIMQKQYLEDIILVFSNTNLVITSSGTMDFDLLFNTIYYNPQMNASNWRNMLVKQRNMQFLQSMEYTDKSSKYIEKRNIVAVIDSNLVSYNGIDKIIAINVEKALDPIVSTGEGTQRKITVFDGNGKYIMGDAEITREVDTNLISKLNDHSGFVKIGQAYFMVSAYNNYIYKITLNDVPTTGQWSFGILLSFVSTILVGILLAFIFAYYINRPLRNIVHNLTGDEVKVQNSVLFLADEVSKMLKENEQNTSRISVMSTQIQTSEFLKLTNSTSYYFKNKNHVDTVFQAISGEKNFLLFGIETNEMKKKFDVLVDEIDKNLCKGLKQPVFIDVSEQQVVLLLGYDQEDFAKKKIIKCIKDSASHCFALYSVFVSNVYGSLSELYEAYADIKVCKEYHIIGEKNDVVDIETINPEIKVYLPDDTKIKVYNYLIAGMKKECIELIHSIIDTNVSKGIYYNKFKLLIQNLSNVVFEALFECNCSNVDVILLERFLEKQLMYSHNLNVDKIKNILANLIRMSVTTDKRADKTLRLNKTDIINYINKNYDKDLYLEHMAELFGTTPKYFSNFFSRGGNESFIEYLTKVRISKAKELLTESDLKVLDVAAKVGYTNTATFTNTFKKYTGVSPTVYRELNMKS